MELTLGLDVGITSVGFCLIDKTKNNIKLMGSHIFDAAEHPKDGSSLALPRREARGLRRIISRRNLRKNSLLKLLQSHSIADTDKIKEHYKLSPWELRKDGLYRKLNDLEFCKAMYHIAKHRGFKSNRKEIAKSKDKNEDGKINKGITELQEKFKNSQAKTIGAYLSLQTAKKRNKDGDYSHTVTRDMIEDELTKLFNRQRQFNNTKASELLELKVKEIILFQRPLKSVNHMRGYCAHFPDKIRAPKYSFSAEKFLFFSKLNNLKILSDCGEIVEITQQMREQVFNEALAKASISYGQLRKLWKLDESLRFNLLKYTTNKKEKTKSENPVEMTLADYEKEKFFEFIGFHTLRKAIESVNKELWTEWKEDTILLDHIANVVSFEFDEEKIKSQLRENSKLSSISEDVLEKIVDINSFSKTINLSIEAVQALLPDLYQGKRYDEAVRLAEERGEFPKKSCKNHEKLPSFEKTNNPVVDRAAAQVRKIINAIIDCYGKPQHIHIELAREMGKSREKRNKEAKRQEERYQLNQVVRKEICDDFAHEAKKDDVIKYKLWKEQSGHCAYSGEYIHESKLFDGSSTEVDHILPFSRSYDNSYMNKVLVFTKNNREKGNLTPYEKWGQTNQWSRLENFAEKLPKEKSRRFLDQNYEKKEQDFKNRHLNDTGYMARLIKNHIENNLDVAVFSISGGITNYLRNSWGLGAKDRDGNKHHAVDAVIIACADVSMVQKATDFNKRQEWEKLRSVDAEAKKPYTPSPWEGFRKDVLDEAEKIFVSRMPNRKIRGEAHAQTIKSFRPNNLEGKQIIKRVNLSSVKLETLENLVDKERNQKLYNLLKERLESHNNEPKKAFVEPIYMPRNNGTEGPIIKGIRIYDNSKSGLIIRNGHVDNGDMVRVDVFSKHNDKKNKLEYYLCPIYVMDVMKKILPNKVFANKGYIEIDENYIFNFSLQKNDFIKICKNDGSEIEGYYVGMHRGTGSISIVEHDKTIKNTTDGIGVKTLKSFEKYHVNYFGERFKVRNKKRLGLTSLAKTKK